MGDRIPPEDSERKLTDSSAESRDTSSFALLLFKSDLLLQSRLLPFPLTHAGREGLAPLVRLLARATPPSLWLTGPVEALRLPLVLWVGRLDIELRPESDSVPEMQKQCRTYFVCLDFVFGAKLEHLWINKGQREKGKSIKYLTRRRACVFCLDSWLSPGDRGSGPSCCDPSLWTVHSGEPRA